MLPILFLSLNSIANATCPSDVIIQDQLTCSNTINGTVDHLAESFLGGSCDDLQCYTCGEPYDNEPQIAPEAVYSFSCQVAGEAALLISDLPCDMDIYVLDDSCDPNTGCLHGSTASYNVDDSVTFECNPGNTYYIVVEAYGVNHLDVASGPCTDDGTSTGNVFSPSYNLQFDLSQSTSCAEDCDDGADNDLDEFADCDDSDCWTDPVCCDLDGDGFFSGLCNGNDCDDENPLIYPGAPEDGGQGNNSGDGLDNDCDDIIDNGTTAYDDDGDGYSEDDGDCDDENPAVNPGVEDDANNYIDDDCDGEVNEFEGLDPKEENSGGGCSCSSSSNSGGNGFFMFMILLLGETVRRRQKTP